ncbi:hypothetical protein ACIBF5_03445 [Micromonospora sp. NPDC050417]|uniref:hypothetical protein n=1 Tax=Micromonospora sp. NPDC050417 TaxID=3364280 RepID=UPI003793E3E6
MQARPPALAPRPPRKGRFWLRLGSTALLLVIAVTSTTFTTAERPAQAASCLAETCNGQWPDTAGCMTANTQEIFLHPFQFDADEETSDDPTPGHDGKDYIGNGTVYYSPECRAAWADFNFSWAEWGATDPWVPDLQFWSQPQTGGWAQTIWAERPVGGSNMPYYQIPGTQTYRTPLVDWNTSIQLCVWIYRSSDPAPVRTNSAWNFDDREACTPWL